MKKSLLTLLAVAAMFVVFSTINRLRLNYTGYCHREERFLSDQEKINRAIEDAMRSVPRPVSSALDADRQSAEEAHGTILPTRFVQYANIQEFTANNQHCCELTSTTREGRKISFIDRLFGYGTHYVHVRHQFKYYTPTGEIRSQEENDYIAVTNCGEVWGGI